MTSKPPVYVPGGAVCSRVLVKSNGCPSRWKSRGNVHDQTCENRDSAAYRTHEPTKTEHTPPNPPATNDFTFSAAAEVAEIGAFVDTLLVIACSDRSPLYNEIRLFRGMRSGEKGNATYHNSLPIGCSAGKRSAEGRGRVVESNYHKLPDLLRYRLLTTNTAHSLTHL